MTIYAHFSNSYHFLTYIPIYSACAVLLGLLNVRAYAQKRETLSIGAEVRNGVL